MSVSQMRPKLNSKVPRSLSARGQSTPAFSSHLLEEFSNKHIVSVDMDGTIADISRRKSFALQFGPDGSHAFYNALLDGSRYHMDEPIVASRTFLHAYIAHTGGEVVYLSGRRQGTEQYSEEWLRVHDFPVGVVLHRATGQRSLNFKLNWLRELKKQGALIDAHFGDRLEDDGGAAKAAGIKFVYIDNNMWPCYPQWTIV